MFSRVHTDFQYWRRFSISCYLIDDIYCIIACVLLPACYCLIPACCICMLLLNTYLILPDI